MKNIIVILTLVLGTQIGLAQNSMDKFEIQVDGLGCPFCAYGLEKKFKEFKGIKAVAIDIETGDFSFLYPADKGLTLEAVEKQVEAAGYTPVTAKVTRSTGTVETLDEKMDNQSAQMAMISGKFKVAGNCNMCKARIEKAAKIPGVENASWDKDSKLLVLSYDEETVALSDIEMAIAKAGHDTENYQADEEVYNALPACCLYERISQ